MDFGDYWQENKRFLTSVSVGLVVFLIGIMVVSSVYGSDLRRERGQYRDLQRNLKQQRYSSRDHDRAARENEALEAALATLTEAVAFRPREEFRLSEGVGSPSNQYFGKVDDVRESLAILAGRQRLQLPGGLGLEMLKTTRTEVIERHLEALDMIDRVVHLAAASRVRRVDQIRVRLDPGLDSKQGVGAVERSRVEFDLTSSAESVVQLIMLSQTDRFGHALAIESLEVKGARSKQDEVRAEIAFLIPRLHMDRDEEDEG